jgi:hypothetical protein
VQRTPTLTEIAVTLAGDLEGTIRFELDRTAPDTTILRVHVEQLSEHIVLMNTDVVALLLDGLFTGLHVQSDICRA